MFNSKNIRKINFLFSALTIIIFIFGFFDVQWRGVTIVNNLPNIEIQALLPVKTIIVNLVGQDYGQLINNVLALNIIWYVIYVFPMWCWNFVKGCFNLEK